MTPKLMRAALVMTLPLITSAPALPAEASAKAGTAQVAVTTSEIQRLQDLIYDISDEIGRVTDSRDRTRLQGELEMLREDVIYLKVKLRKEGTVSRSEYAGVRDRLQDLRSRATQAGTTGRLDTRRDTRGTTGRTTGSAYEVPAGTEIDVRLQTRVSSETAQVEDRVQAVTIADLTRDGRVLIPSGSTVRGVVTAVERATRLDRRGSLTLSFDQLVVNGRTHDIDGQATQVFESQGLKGESERIGAGAAVGGILGGIIGGWKGALAGILIGGGGTVLATEGKEVTLPEGTIIRVRFDRTFEIR